MCIVLLTGARCPSLPDQIAAVGISGYLSKPYTSDTLERALTQALERF